LSNVNQLQKVTSAVLGFRLFWQPAIFLLFTYMYIVLLTAGDKSGDDDGRFLVRKYSFGKKIS